MPKNSLNINSKKMHDASQLQRSPYYKETLASLTVQQNPETKINVLNKVYLNSSQLKRAGLSTGDLVLVENDKPSMPYSFGIAWMHSGTGVDGNHQNKYSKEA